MNHQMNELTQHEIEQVYGSGAQFVGLENPLPIGKSILMAFSVDILGNENPPPK